MAYPRRIAVKPAFLSRYAAVPPYCPFSVIIMAARLRFRRPAYGLLLVGRLAGAPTYARADDAGPKVAPCRPASQSAGTVAAVIDGRTFTLENGREVRLSAIEVPPLPHAAEPGQDGKAGLAAKAALEALIAGREVILKRQGAESDRYGRIAAYAFVSGEGAERSVERELLAQGHARVAARAQNGCAGGLLAAERAARTAKLGLWADPYYAMKRAEKPAELLAQRGRFAIVEGKVLSVRDSGGIIYVNFGRRWSVDFAVTILKRNERTFTAAGLEPNKLTGREVRVRGWIEERGGPRVEATSPEQIEVAERN
jgi:endonuclease YncB( thermonuclease family)